MDHGRIKKLQDRYAKLMEKFDSAPCNEIAEKYLKALTKIKEELWTVYNIKI